MKYIKTGIGPPLFNIPIDKYRHIISKNRLAQVLGCHTMVIAFTLLLFFLAFDSIPRGSELLHIAQITDGTNSGSSNPPRTTLSRKPAERVQPLVFISSGLPPIPSRLVARIQEGHFIDMAELVPERLCAWDTPEEKSTTSKPRDVTDIVEWLQCFGTYIAIVGHTEPQRVPDLLGYQNLIIQGYRKHQKVCWQTYDRDFRRKASASHTAEWSTVDATLWNLAFSGGSSTQPTGPNFSNRDSFYRQPQLSSSKRSMVCLEWNEHRSPGCPHPSCRYEHVCYRCVHNPGIPDKRHKAIFCPNKEKKRQ